MSVVPRTPRVAVIIPNYWDGDTIEDTLRSIDEPEPVEVVVIDDATPDPTAIGKLKRFQEEGLITTLIVKDLNEGASKAVNDGLVRTNAQYIWLFANDDLLRPGMLAQLADVLDDNPQYAFAMGAAEFFGARRHRHVPPQWDPWKVLYRNLWCGSLLIRREVLVSFGGLTDRSVFQDWNNYMNLAESGYFGYVTEDVAYDYKVHGSNRAWASSRSRWKDEYRTLRSLHPDLYSREPELRKLTSAGLFERLWYVWTARILSLVPGVVAEMIFTVVQGFDRFKRERNYPPLRPGSGQ